MIRNQAREALPNGDLALIQHFETTPSVVLTCDSETSLQTASELPLLTRQIAVAYN